jgi:hypothetical protein
MSAVGNDTARKRAIAHSALDLPVHPPDLFGAQHLTLKNLVIKALKEHFPKGADANQLVEFFHNSWGRTDVMRSSLSPQLSRLKVDKVLDLNGRVWTLVEFKNHEAAAE